MKNVIYLFALLFVFGCSSSPTVEPENDEKETPEMNSLDEKIADEEPLGELVPAGKEYVGVWFCDAATCGADLQLVMKEDGTYEQTLAKNTLKGTWEVLESGRLLMTGDSQKS